MKVATCLAVLAGLLVTSPAQAAVYGDAAASSGHYIEAAERFWQARGATAVCPDGIRATWWDYRDGSDAWAHIGGCTVWINPATWRHMARWTRCGLMLHEYGHLAGMHHEYGNPRHIMAPVLGSTHPFCWRYARQYRLALMSKRRAL